MSQELDIDALISVKTEFLIATDTSDSVAWASVYERPNNVLWLTSIWTKTEFRQKGYASAIMRRVLRQFEGRRIYLEVAPFADRPLDAAHLVAFYASFGFEATDVPGVMVRKPYGDA